MPLSQCRAVLIVWIQDLLHWDWLCGLLGPTPSENEVSGQFCLPVRSDLPLVLELCDAFVAMQSGTNCLDSGFASLGLALWLAGTDS